MAKAVKFMLLSLVLGMTEGIKVTTSGLFGGKKGAFLTEEQLEMIEQNLADAKSNKEANEQALADLAGDSAKLSEMGTALNDANATFELNADTPEAVITAMAEKIRALSGEPATKTTTTVVEKEPANTNNSYLESTSLFDQFFK